MHASIELAIHGKITPLIRKLSRKFFLVVHAQAWRVPRVKKSTPRDILPSLRKQKSLKDESTFAGPGGVDVSAVSLWEKQDLMPEPTTPIPIPKY